MWSEDWDGRSAMFAIGRVIGAAFAIVSLILAAGPAVAQEPAPETRIGEEGFESPPATLDQMDWLAGQWLGEGIRGAPAMESWLPPTGGTMVGTFVQETAEGDIMFTEHMYLMQEDGSLALKVKHFNADFTGWEEKDDMLTFRLVALEPCAAYFNALTLRCADKEKPGEGLVAAVRMKSGGELVFRFSPTSAHKAVVNAICAEAETTLDSNICYANTLAKAEQRRREYANAAGLRHADRPELAKGIEASEAAFDAYRDAECGAVYEDWKEGTIRNVMSLTCRIEMTDRRTKVIWQNWLTFMDSTPPTIPEPQSSLK